MRRHHPAGYGSYESYRDWLRDEFLCRCVYCLKRETWGQVTGEFELDHFQPQAFHPHQGLDYLNLVYACRRCNSIKNDQAVGDPFRLLHSESITLLEDGVLHARDMDPRRLIRQLDLNSPRLVRWRTMWMRIITLAEERDAELYHQLVGFPSDLPDLRKLKPPQNHRSEGLEQCCFCLRLRNELVKAY